MTLRDHITTELDRAESADLPLADYLTACLNAFEPNSWQRAVAIRAECDARYPERKDA